MTHCISILSCLFSLTSFVQAQGELKKVKTIQVDIVSFVGHSDTVIGTPESSWVKFNRKGDTIEYSQFSGNVHGKVRYTSKKKIVKELEFSPSFGKLTFTKRIYNREDSLLFNGYRIKAHGTVYLPFSKSSQKYERDELGRIISQLSRGKNDQKRSATISNKFSYITTYTYDSIGHLIRTERPGYINVFEHGSDGSIKTFSVSPQGDSVLRRHFIRTSTDSTRTEIDLLTKKTITYSTQKAIVNTKDLRNYRISVYDSITQSGWFITRDEYNREIQKRFVNSDSTCLLKKNTYNERNLLIYQEELDGTKSSYTYNDDGRLIYWKREKQLDLLEREYEYAQDGTLILERMLVTASYGKQKREFRTSIDYY